MRSYFSKPVCVFKEIIRQNYSNRRWEDYRSSPHTGGVILNKGNGDEKISKMFADKQERIARQVALQSAVDTVTVNPASQIKDPKVISSKVLEIAEIYYKWITSEHK